jgi:hypothetical protein
MARNTSPVAAREWYHQGVQDVSKWTRLLVSTNADTLIDRETDFGKDLVLLILHRDHSLPLQHPHPIEPQHRSQQYLRSIRAILRTRILDRIMANTISARRKDHAGRHSHVGIHRIVACSTGHHLAPSAQVPIYHFCIAEQVLAGFGDTLDAVLVEVGRRRHKVGSPLDAAEPLGGRAAGVHAFDIFSRGDGGESGFAVFLDGLDCFVFGRAHVEAELNPAGNGICRAGSEVQDACGSQGAVSGSDAMAGEDHFAGG